jgi:hypothetical protein
MVGVDAVPSGERRKRLAAVVRFARVRVQRDDVVRVGRIADHLAVVPCGAVLIVLQAPGGSAVVAAIQPVRRRLGMHHRVQHARPRFANAQADPADVAGRKSAVELRPRMTSVRRLVDPTFGPGRQESVLPALTLLRRRIEHVGVGRVHRQVAETGVPADLLRIRPRLSAVGRLVEATLAAGGPEWPERGDVDDVRIARVDDDPADVLRPWKHRRRPGLSAVGRLVDARAPRRAPHVVRLAGAHPHDIGVRRRDRHSADRPGPHRVEHRGPRHAGVCRLPDASRRGAGVDDVADPAACRSRGVAHGDVGDAAAHHRRADRAEHQRAREDRIGGQGVV